MAQAQPTLCGHNAPGQVVRADIPVPCRQCGALIKATGRAQGAATGVFVQSEKQVNATYPGDARTASVTWAFGQ